MTESYTYEYFSKEAMNFRENYLCNKDIWDNKPELIVKAFEGLTYLYFNTPDDRAEALYSGMKTELEYRAKYNLKLLEALLS